MLIVQKIENVANLPLSFVVFKFFQWCFQSKFVIVFFILDINIKFKNKIEKNTYIK